MKCRLAALAAAAALAVLPCCRDGAGDGERLDPAGGSYSSELIAKAFPRFAEAAHRAWPRPGPAMTQAHQAIGRRALNRALKIVQAQLAADPDNPEASFAEGMILYLRSQFGEARPRFEALLEKGPCFAGSETVFHFYGACLMRLGEGVPAREAFQAYLKLRPGDGETCYSLGLLDLEEGHPDQALGSFSQALDAFTAAGQKAGSSMAEQLAKVHSGMGNAYLQKGELEKAEESLRKSVTLDPGQYEVFYALSRVLLRRGDRGGAERAVEEFQRLKAGAGREADPGRSPGDAREGDGGR